MAVWGFSVTKALQWRGAEEEFSNVYYYQEGVLDVARHQAALDQLVDEEKTIFSNLVTFKSGRVWGPIQIDPVTRRPDPVASQQQVLKDYTGTGSVLASQHLHRESAVVISTPLPRSPWTGVKRYLRKYLHVGAVSGGTTGLAYGTDPLPATVITEFESWWNRIDLLNLAGGDYALVNWHGDRPVGSPRVIPYTHIRQFKQ